MAYSEVSITTLDDVPGQVRAFAASLGWAASDVSGTESTITHPTYTGALTVTIRSELTGTGVDRVERLQLTTSLAGTGSGWVYSPKLNQSQADTDVAVEVKQPTKLHLFGLLGGDANDPGFSWIAGVIEYGYNLYRHFYLGYAEKLSSYDGGEIVSGSWQYPFAYTSGSASSRDFDRHVSALPFSAVGYTPLGAGTAYLGGMHLDHVANAEPWRSFYLGSSSDNDFDLATAEWGDRVVLGGYRDSLNAGYLNAGKSPYAGTQILTPVNLYIGKRQSGQQFLQAVGRPGGTRMVHMEDLEPGQSVTVGVHTWRVFPVFARRTETRFPDMSGLSSTRQYPPWNTSQWVGMAYRET